MKTRRLAAALASLPLVAAGIATVPGAVSGAASAACAPGTVRVAHHAKPGHTRTAASSATVTKRHRHAYVASATLTVISGRASVTIAQTVCPDGVDGAAATTTQSATGRGVTTKALKARGASARAAKRALKAALADARRAATEAAATRKGQRKAKKRALAAAKAAALPKAHEALYASDVVYLSKDGAGTYHLSATPPSGSVTISKGPGGEIVLSVPAGTSAAHTTTSACLRRAPAWPTTFVFDGGDVVAPVLEAAASRDTSDYSIIGAPEPNLEGQTDSTATPSGQLWSAGWHQDSPGVVTYRSGLQPDAPFAGWMECFVPESGTSVPYTATLVGAHVGSSASATSTAYTKVVGGIPVELR